MPQRASIWRPEHEAWVRENVTSATGTLAELKQFRLAFPDSRASNQAFSHYVRRIHNSVPESPIPDFTELIEEVQFERCLILSDIHIPQHDAELVRRALDLARAWGVDGTIINGDLWDMAEPSKFLPSLPGDSVRVGDELELGDQLLRAVVEATGRLIIDSGNHDARLYGRWLENQFTSAQVKRTLTPGDLADRIAFSPLGYVNLNRDTSRCGVRVTHPGNTSVIPTAVSADIALQVQMHVISGHGHTIGYRRSRGSHYWVIDSGGMFDPRRMAYTLVKDRRRPLVNQGFVLVFGNRPHLIDPLNVDWDFEMWAATHWRDKPHRLPEMSA